MATQTFKEAFRAARKDPNAMKRGTFTWQGKSYTTKLASEGKSAPKADSSPVGNYYRNRLASDKVSGDASKIRGVSATESAAAQAKAGKSNAASTAPKSPVNAGRTEGFMSRISGSDTGKSFAKSQEAKYGKPTSKSTDTSMNFKERQEKKYGKSRPLLLVGEEARKANKGTIGGYAKGGSIDGIAQRGKTRASLKKGK